VLQQFVERASRFLIDELVDLVQLYKHVIGEWRRLLVPEVKRFRRPLDEKQGERRAQSEQIK
jgi:hypothetical protein